MSVSPVLLQMCPFLFFITQTNEFKQNKNKNIWVTLAGDKLYMNDALTE